jgi:TMEM175 potassium channel family protein
MVEQPTSEQPMGTGRLEAFSDGVIAIIITIMVLELKVPRGAEAATLLAQWPVFLSYALSYLVVAIYWINHHRLFHVVPRVNYAVLWSNNLLLFCLSLIPFATAYMGENSFRPFPTAVYGVLLLACAIAFLILRVTINDELKNDERFAAFRAQAWRKNLISIGLYALSVPAAYLHPAITMALAFAVAGIYFLPETLLEKPEQR